MSSLTDQQWRPSAVQVTVLQARGLRAKGKGGTNDAYAVMQVGKEKFETSVVEKTVTPVWKEEAAFDLPQGPGGGRSEKGTLHVHVLHRALVGPDKLLGRAVIDLLDLSEDRSRNKTEWFKLLDKTGKPDKERGEVLLDIQFTRNNMTASMFDLSTAGKSRSRLGKFKDKVRGKKKESDLESNLGPSFTQVLTDSEEEPDEAVASKDGKMKKHKIKSLFAPKSNLQKSMSQSMSVLPGKDSTLSGNQSSGLNADSSEGKKKFKFSIHKRLGSSDGKEPSSGHQRPMEQSHLCINGSHIYCDEPPSRSSFANSNFSLISSSHGSMEDVPKTFPPAVDSTKAVRQYSPWKEQQEEVDVIKEDVDELKRIEADEEERRNEAELQESLGEARRREERQMAEEKEEELERLRREEEERLEKLRREEEERLRREEEERLEKLRWEEEERLRREEEERLEVLRREEEEKAAEEKRKQQEEERVRKEEELARLAEERQRLELKEVRKREEELERLRREEEERLEKLRREEEERLRREEEERLEKLRWEEEERLRREEEERLEKLRREEEERLRREEEERLEVLRREEEEKAAEEKRKQQKEERVRKEEELARLAEERQRLELKEVRKREEELERLRREEEERLEKLRREEEERLRREEEERLRREEEERLEMLRREEEERLEEKAAEEKRKQQEEEEVRKEEELARLAEERQRLELKELRKREERKLQEEERRMEEERIKKEKMKLEEKRKIEEEERIKEQERIKREDERRRLKEEEERANMEEEERLRKEEEERARKKREEERLAEERRRQEEEERAKSERQQLEEERKLREEEEAQKMGGEKVKRNTGGAVREVEAKYGHGDLEKKNKVSGLSKVTSTNPFDEDFECNPSEEVSPEPQSSTGHQRCEVSISSVGNADERELIGPQREKRPAPQPPGKNQAEKRSQKEQQASDQHLAQMSTQSRDRDVKTVSVPPQRSVKAIAPLSRPPTDPENAQSNANKGATNASKPSKRPAPSVPLPTEEGHPVELKKTTLSCVKLSNLNSSETKHVRKVYSLNPFDDDEDDENGTQDKGDSDAASQPANKDDDAQPKIKSSKMARAPPPPSPPSTLTDPISETGHDAKDPRAASPENAAKQSHGKKLEVQVSQPVKVQNNLEAGVKKVVAPVPSRRLQPVRPLNPLEQQPGSSVLQGGGDDKSTGTLRGVEEKSKVSSDGGSKGPFSQLTREELISLVLKQEAKLLAKDEKITELECYIDNLLVRVMEQQPSILMSLSSSLNKAA
ncbi:uncharacterized protein KZ484_000315 isoform 2-T2 [Pholidichthys leucotaenia]